MRTYKITFEIVSSIRTPLHSDTIFGHICWAIRFLYGENMLSKWLKNYGDSPTLITNAFPDGLFPRPVTRPLSFQELAKIFNFDPNNPDLEILAKLKKVKKIKLIPEDWFWKNRENLSTILLTKMLMENIETKQYESESVLIAHNRYNRFTGKVDDGGLFEFEETFYKTLDGNNLKFWILINTDTLSTSMLKEIMDYISLNGFGADKSIGKGALKIISVEEHTLPVYVKANAFMSLSNFIPAKKEEINGYYNILIKFGKLGGLYASGYNPFKKPIIMLEAGAVILDSQIDSDKYYGKLQKNVHTDSAIKHYGYAFSIPIYYEE